MATNLRLLDNNLLFGSTVSVSGQALHISLPVSNVIDSDKKRVWRSNGTAGTITFDIGSRQNVNVLGLINSNLGTEGTVVLRASGGAARISNQTGTYSVSNTWASGTVPQEWDQVITANNHIVVLDTSPILGIGTGTAAVDIQSGGTLSVPGTKTIDLYGFLQVNGQMDVGGKLSVSDTSAMGSAWTSPGYSSGDLNPAETQTGVRVFFFPSNKFNRFYQLVMNRSEASTDNHSANTGTYSVANTWDTGTTPQPWDTVSILSTHTVELDANVSLGTGTGITALNINSGGTMSVSGTYNLDLFGVMQIDGQLTVTGKLTTETAQLYSELGVAWLGTYIEFERGVQYGWDSDITSQSQSTYSTGGSPYSDDFTIFREINLRVEHLTEYWTVNTLMPTIESIVGKKDVIFVLSPDDIANPLGENTNLYGRLVDHFKFSETDPFKCNIDIHLIENL